MSNDFNQKNIVIYTDRTIRRNNLRWDINIFCAHVCERPFYVSENGCNSIYNMDTAVKLIYVWGLLKRHYGNIAPKCNAITDMPMANSSNLFLNSPIN